MTKSDSAILAGNPTNKAEQSAAESVERRMEAGILEDGVVTVSDKGDRAGVGGIAAFLPTSTCTTSSISGPSGGEGVRPRAT
jgi:hypothetical protein